MDRLNLSETDRSKFEFLRYVVTDAHARAEPKLLKIRTPEERMRATESFLHIPIADANVVHDLRQAMCLLDLEYYSRNREHKKNDASPSASNSSNQKTLLHLMKVYHQAYCDSWDLLQKDDKDGSIMAKVEEAVKRRQDKHGFKCEMDPSFIGTVTMDEIREMIKDIDEDPDHSYDIYMKNRKEMKESCEIYDALPNEQTTSANATRPVGCVKEEVSPGYTSSADLMNAFVKKRKTNEPIEEAIKSKQSSDPMDIDRIEPKSKSDDQHEDCTTEKRKTDFLTAKQKLIIDAQLKGGGHSVLRRHGSKASSTGSIDGADEESDTSKRLGSSNRRVKFVPPMLNKSGLKNCEKRNVSGLVKRAMPQESNRISSPSVQEEHEVDERLKNIDPKMVEMIQNEIMSKTPSVAWDDIAGLEHAKRSIQEMIIWPMLRPDIFTGLRRAPKGLLLFGPPGTGKTLIGKCIAGNAGCTFFSISASSLTSKWIGEGEKMVRALFAVARVHQPAVIFVDEIDSLLTQRTDGEVEASRRIKTEFLIQFDGAHIQNPDEDRILVVGATNRPQEIDEAARRRLIKRFYIPLPSSEARAQIIRKLLKSQTNGLSETDIQAISEKSKGYSGSDMDGLCREAALGPIREIPPSKINSIALESVRPITVSDFEMALTQVRASVSDRDLDMYEEWNKNYGSLPDSFVRES